MTPLTPRPGTKCRRCDAGYSQHRGLTYLCPDGSGRTYRRTVPSRGASSSFTPTEIDVLDHVVRQLLSGSAPDLQRFARQRAADIGHLAGKVAGMKQAAERRKQMHVVDSQHGREPYGSLAKHGGEDESA